MVSGSMKRRVALFLLKAASFGLGAAVAPAAELPIPCGSGSCGPNVAGFIQSGQASAVTTANTLRVHQTSDRAALNWSSFNIGADGRVVFEQPNSSSIALNRIYEGSPSR